MNEIMLHNAFYLPWSYSDTLICSAVMCAIPRAPPPSHWIPQCQTITFISDDWMINVQDCACDSLYRIMSQNLHFCCFKAMAYIRMWNWVHFFHSIMTYDWKCCVVRKFCHNCQFPFHLFLFPFPSYTLSIPFPRDSRGRNENSELPFPMETSIIYGCRVTATAWWMVTNRQTCNPRPQNRSRSVYSWKPSYASYWWLLARPRHQPWTCHI